MHAFLLAAAAVLALNIVASSVRIVRGPTTRDRTTAMLLLSTTGAAVLVLLAEAASSPALRDTALALVALSAVIVAARISAERAPR